MNAKKLLSTLLSAAMAVSMLAGCFGGSNDFSREAAKAANKAQDTVEFSTDSRLTKSLLEALEENIQTYDVHDAMEADENLEVLLTSGYDLDIHAVTAEDAKAAAEAIAQLVAKEDVSGKKSTGYISMVLNDNHYYYAAVLTYRTGNSGGSGSGDGSQGGDNPEDHDKTYSITVNIEGNGTVKVGENAYSDGQQIAVSDGDDITLDFVPDEGSKIDTVTVDTTAIGAESSYTFTDVADDHSVTVKFAAKQYTVTVVNKNTDGGEISTTGGKVDHGESFIFEVKPRDGYQFNVTVIGTAGKVDKDTTPDGEGNYTVTVPNVRTDLRIEVDFIQTTYTVTLKIDEESQLCGTVKIDGVPGIMMDSYQYQNVTPSTFIVFSVQAGQGYEIDRVVSDLKGELKGEISGTTDPKYTLTGVTKDDTVTVYFKAAK